MKYAPVGICTYNRLDHLKKTIRALQKNTLASDSSLFIYSDAPRLCDAESVGRLREYIHQIVGFKDITIIERDNNSRFDNCRGGILELLHQYGKVIWMEDDIVTAPGFLQFMNDALVTYQDREDIMNIVGYRPPLEQEPSGSEDAFLFQRYLGWGLATWLDKFLLIDSIDVDRFQELMSSDAGRDYIIENCGGSTLDDITSEFEKQSGHYDVQATFHEIYNSCYSVFPRKSLVNNIGHDGTGINCGITNKFLVPLWDKITGFKLNKDLQKEQIIIHSMAEFFSYKDSVSQEVVSEIADLINNIECDSFSIWGIDHLTDLVLKRISKHKYDRINYFIDSWAEEGLLYNGKPVLHLEAAVDAGEDNIFILSIASRKYMQDLIRKLPKPINSYIYHPIVTTAFVENIADQLQKIGAMEISVWGVENLSDAFLNHPLIKNLKINYLIESNPYPERTYLGIEVITPSEAISRGEKTIVILSPTNKQSMKQQLHALSNTVNVISYEVVTENVAENIALQLRNAGVEDFSVWGVENISNAFLNNETVAQLTINYIIESSLGPEREFNGIEIITPAEALERGEHTVVILSAKNKLQMKQQLYDLSELVKVIAYEVITDEIADNIATQIESAEIKSCSVWGIANLSEAFRKKPVIAGLKINYFIESEPYPEKYFQGIEVLTPEQAVKRGESVVILLSLKNKLKMKQQLYRLSESVTAISYDVVTEEVARNIAVQMTTAEIRCFSVWGVENLSDAFLKNTLISELKINYLIDSKPFPDKYFRGLEIIAPEEAVDRGEKNIAILSLKNGNEMKQYIKAYDKEINTYIYES